MQQSLKLDSFSNFALLQCAIQANFPELHRSIVKKSTKCVPIGRRNNTDTDRYQPDAEFPRYRKHDDFLCKLEREKRHLSEGEGEGEELGDLVTICITKLALYLVKVLED